MLSHVRAKLSNSSRNGSTTGLSAPLQQLQRRRNIRTEVDGGGENSHYVDTNKDDNGSSHKWMPKEIDYSNKNTSTSINISVEEQCLIALGKIQITNALIRFESAHCSINDHFGKIFQ